MHSIVRSCRSWVAPSLSTITAVVLLGGPTVACSSSTSPEEAPKTVKVQGAFEGRSGPILKLLLADAEYTLVTKECESEPAPCVRGGTFVIRQGAGVIELTDARTKRTSSLPLAVLDSREVTATPEAASAPIHVAGLCLVNSWDPGGCCLTNPSGCTPRPEGPSSPSTSLLPGGQSSLVVQCTGNCAVTITINGQTLTATGERLSITAPVPPQ